MKDENMGPEKNMSGIALALSPHDFECREFRPYKQDGHHGHQPHDDGEGENQVRRVIICPILVSLDSQNERKWDDSVSAVVRGRAHEMRIAWRCNLMMGCSNRDCIYSEST